MVTGLVSTVTKTAFEDGSMATLAVEILDATEVKSLVDSCSRRAPTGIRNAALLVLLYRSGLRIAEALALRPKDVDLAKSTVRVLHGKNDKARTVGIDQMTAVYVQRWMDKRKQLGITARHALFCVITDRKGEGGSKKGTAMSQAYVRGFLARTKKKAGVEKRVHAHGFRHTHAAELASEGTAIHVIQQQLGHSNVAVTSKYINHLSPQQVIEATTSRKSAW